MFNNWSIKRLLQFWASGTVIVVVMMALMANYASSLISSAQSASTDELLPLENSSRRLSSVVSAMSNRQNRLLAADSEIALEQLPSRAELEQQFQQNWLRLEKIFAADKTDAEQVDSLFDYYQDFLILDDELLRLKQQFQQINARLTRHNQDVEIQAGKLKLQLDELDERLQVADIPEGRRLITDLYPVFHRLAVFSYKSFAVDDDESLAQLSKQELQPLVEQQNSLLASLVNVVRGNSSLWQLAGAIKRDSKTLVSLIRGDNGLYQLQSERLLTASLLKQGQQDATAVMAVMMSKLDQLADAVNRETYSSVENEVALADRIRWQIIMLGSLITLGMIIFAYVLSRGINNPIQAIRTAMHALSEGHFQTRMPETQSRNEVSLLARDFNQFAENTQQMIDAFAEARQSLQSREQHLRAILNGVPEAILTLSADGIIQNTNPAAEQVFRASKLALKGQSLLRFFAEDESINSMDELAARAGSGAEFEGQRFDDEALSMWVSISRLAGVEDDEDSWVCVISDITVWKKTDHQLQQTTTELDAILENAMVGIAFIRDRQFIRINHKFEQLFGFHREQIEGQSSQCIYPNPQAYEHFCSQAIQVLEQGDSYEAHLELVRSDGDNFWCALSGKAINPHDPDEGAIWLFEDVTSQRENEERLTRLASIDTLTGLPNRSVFNDRLEHAIHKAHRNSNRLAVFFLDLDHFKNINDSLGHKAGDVLLSEVARRIKACVREGDTVARLGGDEFTLILEEIRSAEYVGKVAEKVLQTLSKPYMIDGTEVSISPSIGVSLYPADGRDIDMLLRNADAAMYHAKKNGRNNFQFYSVEMNARAAQRLAMETALRRAVEQHEFYLQYQPQIDLRTGHLAGTEVLLRWNSVQWGEVSPTVFVPILEDTGLIGVIGEWVLRQACETYLAMADKLPLDFMLAVNLSGRQFRGGALASDIRRLLFETGMPASNLELEITESMLMDDTELAVATLRQLSELGISLAIDDFGTGYSSLSHLKQFPLNVLKIDSTFVSDVTSDQDDAAIVDAIIAMSSSLQLRVIAEGVETQEQLAFLKQRQCDLAQGYLFSRPLDKDAFIDYLQREPLQI